MSELFNYAVNIARKDAARILRADGKKCQCGHLMHVSVCGEFDPTKSTIHSYCRCTYAKVMGESYTCGMTNCEQQTEVVDGIAKLICTSCTQKTNAATARRMAALEARREARRG